MNVWQSSLERWPAVKIIASWTAVGLTFWLWIFLVPSAIWTEYGCREGSSGEIGFYYCVTIGFFSGCFVAFSKLGGR